MTRESARPARVPTDARRRLQIPARVTRAAARRRYKGVIRPLARANVRQSRRSLRWASSDLPHSGLPPTRVTRNQPESRRKWLLSSELSLISRSGWQRYQARHLDRRCQQSFQGRGLRAYRLPAPVLVQLLHRAPLLDHHDAAVWGVVDGVQLTTRLFVHSGDRGAEDLDDPIVLARRGIEVRGDDNGRGHVTPLA